MTDHVKSDVQYVLDTSFKIHNGLNGITDYATHIRRQTDSFFHSIGIHQVTQIHHLTDPSNYGCYKQFVETKINEKELSRFQTEYEHDPTTPMVATCKDRTQLLFIPSILNNEKSWKKELSIEEGEVFDRLHKACNDPSGDSLLNFRLNDKFTIKTALDILAQKEGEYHHNVLHLRWSWHTLPVTSEIHNFESPGKQKVTNPKTGKIIQPGEVQMVRSVYIVGSAKQAFDTIVIPCAKITEYYLKRLPDDLFPKRMKGAGSFFDLECSYLSLNFYWKKDSWFGCWNKYWSKGKSWVFLDQKHPGLFCHADYNNWGFGAVLIFGCDISGFDQRYITYALRLPCPGWSLVIGNYRELLHAVSSGSATLRMSLVVTNHKCAVLGVNEFGKKVHLRNEDNYEETRCKKYKQAL